MQTSSKNLGFSLIELIIVITIAAILAKVGFSGYIDNLRLQRRQDAVLSLQKAYLTIANSTTVTQPTSCPAAAATDCNTANICSANNASFPCISANGFYCITYCPSATSAHGFDSSGIASADKQYLTNTEVLLIRASAISGKGQDKDAPNTCQTIYLSDQNNLFPSSCIH